jgi:hypothetical protein
MNRKDLFVGLSYKKNINDEEKQYKWRTYCLNDNGRFNTHKLEKELQSQLYHLL